MNPLADFFNSSKTFQAITVPTGRVNVRTTVEESSESEPDEPVETGTAYAKEYEERERQLYNEEFIAKQNAMSCVESTYDLMSDDEEKNAVMDLKKRAMTSIYSEYQFTANTKTQIMPIDSYKESILEMLNTTATTIIHGPTGCGKTTQVPQFILDKHREANEYCNIVVTQPRRIAAISIARRVCQERGWVMGTVCGYQVGLEKNVSNDTILTYMTTGVLLQKLVGKKSLREYTHIIIDEVHERTQEMDFLLLVIRKYLYTNSPNVKVILMSATIDTVKFANYFRTHSVGYELQAPTIFVDNESNFKTLTYYMEDLRSLGVVPIFKPDEPVLHPSLYDIVYKLIYAFDKLDKEEHAEGHIGHVLIFLPGIQEIEELYNHLKENRNPNNSSQWLILPLHSTITAPEQAKVFISPPEGIRKIILSTNIAESSITVADVEYVIDFCLTKILVTDPISHYQSLKLEWASKVNCTQRSGRVGRCSDGRVYRMVPKFFYQEFLSQEVIPEIKRAPLERIVLCCKMLELNEPPKSILSLAIDPPNIEKIDQTILNLKEIGALLTTVRGEFIRGDGDLTFVGQIMANLPIDVRFSKLITLGYMFSCLKECIIMAAGCSLTNIFSSPFQEKLKSYSNRVMWADGSNSDLLAYLNLYKVWERNCNTGFKHNRDKIEWCLQNYLSLRTMKEWDIMILEIKSRLDRMGITESVGPGHVTLSHVELPLVLKIVICGAFYPNYFKRSVECGHVEESEAVKMLNGLDPKQSIYFTNMDPHQPGALYAKRIKEYLKHCTGNMNVYFSSSSKVYVTFLDTNEPQTVNIQGNSYLASMPGKVSINVYKAIRMRQIKNVPIINVLPSAESWRYSKRLGLQTVTIGGIYMLQDMKAAAKKTILPSITDITINITVTHVIDAGHFYAQLPNEQLDTDLAYIDELLNSGPLTKVTEKIMVGDLYATRFSADNRFYRCKVLALSPFKKNDTLAQIIYVDFGNTTSVLVDNLYSIPNNRGRSIPELAMECVLCGIQPSVIMNPKALWSDEANSYCSEKINGKCFTAKVYSVVNGVVSLELYSPGNNLSLNEFLLRKGYAQHMEESFLSKNNNAKRLQAQSYQGNQNLDVIDLEETNFKLKQIDVQPPPLSETRLQIRLKGPFSPLETSVYSCINNVKVNIEMNSVNAVLLDTDPQDKHDRLLVAVQVSQSPNSSSLTLRHTTLMPSIPGFPALMGLLFCPTMVIKPIESGTCFGAVLCGLGSHPTTKKPLYPDHDMVFTLDTEIDTDDLKQINEIRYWFNHTISSMKMIFNKTSPSVQIEICQREIKDRLFKLLKKYRNPQERHYVKHADSWTKYEYVGDFLLPGKSYMDLEIWNLHKSMVLNKLDEKTLELKRNENELLEYAREQKTMEGPVLCRACDETLYYLSDLRVHVSSQSHKKRMTEVIST